MKNITSKRNIIKKQFKQIQKAKMQSGNIGDIMHQQQMKELISKLVKLDIKDYASSLWYKQDQKLQKLNMQLHVNAIMKNDQFILEEMLVQDKFQLLIIDLLITSVWKKRVLPLLKSEISTFNSLKVYLAVYHEAVVCNMLQVMLYHYTAIKESKSLLIQIIDYCYKKITPQIGKSVQKRLKQRQSKPGKEQGKKQLSAQQLKQKKLQKILNKKPEEQFQTQIQEIEFSIFIMCVSIFKYITDSMKQLEIGVLHHIIVQTNIFSLLVPLIQEKPWLRENDKGERQIFQNNKWSVVPKSQYGRLPKAEGQVWLTLYNLFANQDCMKKYELNDERKNMLLRLRKFMNEVLLDQIPALSAMLRSLQHLSMTNVPSHLSSNPFVVQQVPVALEEIERNIDWKQMANQHRQRLKQSLDVSEKEHMMRLAQLYSNNNVEGLIQGFKCGKCQKQAFKRCSKCKGVWYCSRECQVGDWPAHKVKCNQRSKQLQQMQQKAKTQQKTEKPAAPKPNLIDQLD